MHEPVDQSPFRVRSLRKSYIAENGVAQRSAQKKAGHLCPAFLSRVRSESANAVFENDLLQSVDGRVGLQGFPRERVAVRVGDEAAVAIGRHESIGQYEFFTVGTSSHAEDTRVDIVADDAVVNFGCLKIR